MCVRSRSYPRMHLSSLHLHFFHYFMYLIIWLSSVSKQIMSQSSVPVVPGYFGDDQSDTLLKKEADQIG